MFEEPRRTVSAKSRDALDARPIPPKPNPDGFHVACTDFDASFRVRFVTAVGGDTAQKPDKPLGQRVADVLLTKALRQGPECETSPGVDFLVRCLLAKLCDERLLEFPSERKASCGGVLDSRMDIDGDAHVVRCDTDFLKRAEDLAKLLRRATAFVHQLIGRHTGVRLCVRQGLDDAQHLLPDIASNVSPVALTLNAFACGGQARETQGRGKDASVVLVASRELRFLQPRDGGAHPVVVRGAVAREFAVIVL